jgi:hypothetical protein
VVLDDTGENTVAGHFAASDAEGLAQALAAAEGAFTCDPELLEAGRALGFAASDGPGDMALWRLAMPISFAYGAHVESPEIELLVVLARTGAAFDAVRAPLQVHRGRPFSLELTGSATLSRVGLIHGDASECGLTLVKDRDTFDHLERMVLAGLADDATALGLTMATLDLDTPAYLAPSLAALGARGLVLPRHLDQDGPQTVQADQLWALSAAMHALAALGDLTEVRAHLALSGGDAVDIALRYLEWDFAFALDPKARA